MKKAIIYYFSGTGNTAKVAGLYKKYLAEYGEYDVTLHQVRMVEKKYTEFPSPEEFDLVGFGFPVHGFNCPKAMNDFTKLLPSFGNGKGTLREPQRSEKLAFVFKTSGEGLTFNLSAAQKIIRRLEKKGYKFLTDRHFVMPYNMIFRHTPEMVKSEWLYADALARLNSKEITEGKTEKVHRSRLKAWFVPIIRIEWIYAQLQGPAMKVDMKKCVKCQKCVKNCPLGNIKYDEKKGKFKFGTNCALCVACSFGCPTKAISIGLLNGWRVNGDYKIEETVRDPNVAFPAFGENLRGLKRWLYYKYYRKLDKIFEENGIELKCNF